MVTRWSVDPEEYDDFLSKVWDEWVARDCGKVLISFCETPVVQHIGMPAYSKQCEFLTDCWGECPKNRLLRTPDGEPGLNYLCPGRKRFFAHAVPTATNLAARFRVAPRSLQPRM